MKPDSILDHTSCCLLTKLGYSISSRGIHASAVETILSTGQRKLAREREREKLTWGLPGHKPTGTDDSYSTPGNRLSVPTAFFLSALFGDF